MFLHFFFFCLQSMAQEKMAWTDLARIRLFRILKSQVSRERTNTSALNRHTTGKQFSFKLFGLEE